MRRRVVMILVSVLGTAAHADVVVPDQARQLAERGRAFHDAGDYADAIAAFMEAYVLAPRPGLLFNIAQAYRLAGQCDDAAWMYQRYLDSDPSDEQRTLAKANLDSVERCGTGGLRVVVAGPPPAIPVPADAAVTVPDSDGSTGRRDKLIGTGLVLGGVAALAAAGFLALDSGATKSGKGPQITTTDSHSELATGFAIGGGLAVVSGAVLYGLGRHYERIHHANAMVVPHAHGAAITLAWAF